MIQADAKCKDCEHTYQIEKVSIMDDFITGKCPKCGSENTKRVFGIGMTDVAIGTLGNSKTGFSKSPTYHPGVMGRCKGTRIK